METNRPYISYSQYALFNSSPKAFYERYVNNKKNHGTKYQQFGKKLMEDLEFGELDKIPNELKTVVSEGIIEHEITIEPKGLSKDMFGIVDAISDDKKFFYEIKTGKHAWAHLDVMKDEQILFYAMLIERKYKVLPKAYLVWAKTEDEDGSVEFTGQVKVFPREFTAYELDEFYMKVQKTVVAIDEYIHAVTSVNNSIDDRLTKLIAEKSRIDNELDALKSEILLDLKQDANKYAESENFNITLVERSNWEYSKGLKDMVKEQGAEIKMMKHLQEKDGTAKKSITEYLLIKAKK